MYRSLSVAALMLLSATTAGFAGGVAPPPPPPIIIPEVIEDPFDGFYVGLEYGHAFGTITVIESGDPAIEYDIEDASVYGIFGGYNVQNGSMVYGGELRYLHVNADPTPDFTAVDIENVLDIRGRVGFVLGSSALVYGALGYSMASATSTTGDIDFTGLNYGVGAEYNINEGLFLGVDLTGRDLSGSTPGFDFESNLNTLTLRAGLRF